MSRSGPPVPARGLPRGGGNRHGGPPWRRLHRHALDRDDVRVGQEYPYRRREGFPCRGRLGVGHRIHRHPCRVLEREGRAAFLGGQDVVRISPGRRGCACQALYRLSRIADGRESGGKRG